MSDALTTGTVKVPGLGPTKKVYLYAGVGAVGVLAAYIMWRRNQAAQADATPADASLGDGLTTAAGSDAYGNPAPNGGNTSDYTGDAGRPTAQNNEQWTQYVLDDMGNYFDSGLVLSTVSKYLQRVPLSSDEGSLIRQAWTLDGKPPEGPSNFTLTTDGSTPGSTTALSAPTGLTVGSATTSSLKLDWGDVSGATGYDVYKNGSVAGSPTSSSYTASGLSAGTSYSFSVKAKNASQVSASSAAVTGKTTAAGTTKPPTTKPGSKPPAPKYVTVTVAAFTSHNPPWNSTISGIAGHYGNTAAGVWNDPKNAALRRLRKQPDLIRPKDKVYVLDKRK